MHPASAAQASGTFVALYQVRHRLVPSAGDVSVSITVEQIRARCCLLRMRDDDVDTIADLLQRRKEGRRFNVRSSYRTVEFN